MKRQRQQPAILLVLCLICCAPTHSFVTSSSAEAKLLQTLGDATKALQVAQKSLQAAAQTQTSSVVQDWSLVCKELCGAGLGVAPCANYCATPGDKTTILSPQIDSVKCEQLCGLHLGGALGCECHVMTEQKSQYSGDQFCSSFCLQRGKTLTGCSPCQLLGHEVTNTEMVVSAKQSKATHGSTVDIAYLSETDPVLVSDLVNGVEPLEPLDGDPDWNELCKSLCQTGDGGSLCNCDLAPFFT